MTYQAAHRLPPGARRALLDGLASGGDPREVFPHEVFLALGRSLGVRDVAVYGDFGVVSGALSDEVMLSAYLRTRTWSPVKTAFLADCFAGRNQGTYLDIGANIGLTTLPVARNAAIACKAFEPDPTAFRYLGRNVADNGHRNVELFNLALFDRRARFPFELSEQNPADHRLSLQAEPGRLDEQRRTRIEIQAERLNDVLPVATLASPIVAKIVAQGAEAHIVAGGQDVLSAADAVVVQAYPYALARAHGDPEVLVDFLAGRFDRGAIKLADDAQPLVWQPIDEIADWLSDYLRSHVDAPYSYHHVFAVKSQACA